MCSTSMRSVIHSMGARSSVMGSDAAATGRICCANSEPSELISAAMPPVRERSVAASLGVSSPTTSWLKRSAGQRHTCGNTDASVPPTASGRRWSSGTWATLRAMAPPLRRCWRASWKNSRVAM